MQMWSYFILTCALHFHQTDHISGWLLLLMKWITALSVSSVEAGGSSVPIDEGGCTKHGTFLPCMEPGLFTPAEKSFSRFSLSFRPSRSMFCTYGWGRMYQAWELLALHGNRTIHSSWEVFQYIFFFFLSFRQSRSINQSGIRSVQRDL